MCGFFSLILYYQYDFKVHPIYCFCLTGLTMCLKNWSYYKYVSLKIQIWKNPHSNSDTEIESIFLNLIMSFDYNVNNVFKKIILYSILLL